MGCARRGENDLWLSFGVNIDFSLDVLEGGGGASAHLTFYREYHSVSRWSEGNLCLGFVLPDSVLLLFCVVVCGIDSKDCDGLILFCVQFEYEQKGVASDAQVMVHCTHVLRCLGPKGARIILSWYLAIPPFSRFRCMKNQPQL